MRLQPKTNKRAALYPEIRRVIAERGEATVFHVAETGDFPLPDDGRRFAMIATALIDLIFRGDIGLKRTVPGPAGPVPYFEIRNQAAVADDATRREKARENREKTERKPREEDDLPTDLPF